MRIVNITSLFTKCFHITSKVYSHFIKQLSNEPVYILRQIFENLILFAIVIFKMSQLFFLIVLVVAILLHPENSLALGINCRGSIMCKTVRSDLNTIIDRVCSVQNQVYEPGQHIGEDCDAFEGGLAAFTAKTESSITSNQACSLLSQLRDHGCGVCGSIPIDYPRTNNVNNGELTVNYVTVC